VTVFEYVKYAQTYGALLVALEHRFYGESIPLEDLSTKNLAYLSSEQALADAANFITQFRDANAPNSPIVTFGGSYPGNLAAWFREKYPHITIGSIASSAPVQATLDFFLYLDVVDASLTSITGKRCDAQIYQATQQLQSMLNSSQNDQVQSMFNTCTVPESDLDIANFISSLMGNFMEIVQYDDEGGNPITIQTLCNIMDNGSNVLANYAQVNQLFLSATGQKCLDISYSDMIEQLSNVSSAAYSNGVGARTWTYQTCSEFGYFQTTDSDNQPFGNLVPLSFYLQMCNDLGWNWIPRVAETNINYGGNNPTGTTAIVFVNGSLDPWHSLSVTQNIGKDIQAILIEGTAHCADMFPARQQDPPGLAQAQEQISEMIGKFLINSESWHHAEMM